MNKKAIAWALRTPNKYLEYIKDVGEGKTNAYLAEYLDPTIKDKKWYEKYKKVRVDSFMVNLDLTKGRKK